MHCSCPPSTSQLRVKQAGRVFKALPVRPTCLPRRTHVVRAQADSGASQILEAFYYGRAFAVTLNKRLGEAVTDVIAEVSKLIAENPTRLKEFQDEVEALARSELPGSSDMIEASSSAAEVDPMAPGGTLDLQAVVDDLRAEIASARAVLQSIKIAKVES